MVISKSQHCPKNCYPVTCRNFESWGSHGVHCQIKNCCPQFVVLYGSLRLALLVRSWQLKDLVLAHGHWASLEWTMFQSSISSGTKSRLIGDSTLWRLIFNHTPMTKNKSLTVIQFKATSFGNTNLGLNFVTFRIQNEAAETPWDQCHHGGPSLLGPLARRLAPFKAK